MAELPGLRIDHYPRLCSLGGHAVPLFELVLSPAAARRAVPVLGGVAGAGIALLAWRDR